MNETIDIRKAVHEDYPEIFALVRDTWKEFVPKATSRHLSGRDVGERSIKRLELGFPSLVATAKGIIIGVVYAKIPGLHLTSDEQDSHKNLQDDEWYLLHLTIHPDYRNRGIATDLIKGICKMAEQDEKVSVKTTTWSTNKIAIRSYEKAGFQKESETFDDRGHGVGTIVLRKFLAEKN